jgi:hypothetical protein
MEKSASIKITFDELTDILKCFVKTEEDRHQILNWVELLHTLKKEKEVG